ncbi:aminoacyl-tRNA hydrolase [Atopobium deltae]|uniref:Peptidyl-tRNA hydrolase n=1 Tax=Atopobium deltae TaxID=1393034 RepID=A0A133XPX8_9ACTN|nr:aminoacyl-tRNA hydrolase [Atopobium deltae]KXB32978.1 aminoacyl-tRNA hydrolase [Atopobium deltae]
MPAQDLSSKELRGAQNIRMICGLGNPGSQYAYTRHNIGFAVIDAIAESRHITYWKDELGAQVGVYKHRAQGLAAGQNQGAGQTSSQEILLVKPQSFMNTSGGPLAKLAQRYHIAPEEILAIHDEVDLPEGDIRLKCGGGLNAHNGLRSIAQKLGTRNFYRLRMGIGRPPGKMDVATYVLRELKGNFKDDFVFEAQQGAQECLRFLGWCSL